MWDFVRAFIPAARSVFQEHPNIESIFWVEDDIKIGKGVVLNDIVSGSRACAPSAGWLGYIPNKGQPRWGSHFVSLTSWSLNALAESDDATSRDWYGLDTFVCRMLSKRSGRRPIVKVGPRSLVGQRHRQDNKRGMLVR